MSSYRRGLRNGVLVNPKLSILEKFNLVKLSQTWSNVLKTCIIWYELLQAVKRRSAEKARQVIYDLAKCKYKAPSKALGSSSILRGSGVIELNRMTAIKGKLDALMSKLGNIERRMHTILEVGAVDEGERRNSAKEGLTHEGPYQVEEAQYLNAN